MEVLEKLIEVALIVSGKDSFNNWFTKCCYCN